MAPSLEDIADLEKAEKIAARLDDAGLGVAEAIADLVVTLKQVRNRPPEPKTLIRANTDDADWLWASDYSGAMYRVEKNNTPFRGQWMVRTLDGVWGLCASGSATVLQAANGEKFVAIKQEY